MSNLEEVQRAVSAIPARLKYETQNSCCNGLEGEGVG